MNFLPVAQLEMRTAARKPMTYYARCLVGLLAISTGLGFVFAGFNGAIGTASAGQAVFGLLAASGYAMLATQGMLLTCDCISQEKREGTLGLLFLTDLNGFDIVVGKLIAQVGRSWYCLLAAFPAFGFCLILGGVSFGDFVLVALGLLNTLFYFSALGMLISACLWRERIASGLGGLALLVLGVLLPLTAVFWNFAPVLTLVPAGAMMAALGPLTGITVLPDAAASLLVPHLMGWAFLGAASYLVPRNWAPSNPATSARRQAVRATKDTSLPPWVAKPANSLTGSALLVMLWAVIVLVVPFGSLGITVPIMAGMIFLLHTILKFQAVTYATRMLAGRRRSGELELLLTTPCDEDEIVRHCVLALKRSLLWPVLLALGVDIALIVFGWWQIGIGNGFTWAAIVASEMIWLLVNLYSLTWVGLYLGLKLANPAKAAGQAILCVLLLPWILVTFFALLAAMVVPGHHIDTEVSVPIVGVFLVALFFCNTYFTGRAITELRDQFRAVAADTWARP